jgi:uncharacterized protein YqeY
MTLREQLSHDLISAMKSKDAEKVSTLRFLISAIKYKEVDKKSDLVDSEIVEVISKQVKTHKESIESFKSGNRPDLVAKEEVELAILQSYLPAQMSESDLMEIISKIVNGLKPSGKPLDFGMVMREVMPQVKGKAEGALVKKVVEECLKQ